MDGAERFLYEEEEDDGVGFGGGGGGGGNSRPHGNASGRGGGGWGGKENVNMHVLSRGLGRLPQSDPFSAIEEDFEFTDKDLELLEAGQQPETAYISGDESIACATLSRKVAGLRIRVAGMRPDRPKESVSLSSLTDRLKNARPVSPERPRPTSGHTLRVSSPTREFDGVGLETPLEREERIKARFKSIRDSKSFRRPKSAKA